MHGCYARTRAEAQDLALAEFITSSFPATTFERQLDEWKRSIEYCGMMLSHRTILRLALVLFARTDKDGRLVADPTYEQLAKAAGCGVRTAKRVMPAAEKTGVVRKLLRSDGRISNVWELILPTASDANDADEAPEKMQEFQCPTVPNTVPNFPDADISNRATVGTVLRDSSTLIERYTSYEERGYVPSLNTDRDVYEDTGAVDPEKIPELRQGKTIEAAVSFPTTSTVSAPIGAIEELNQRKTERPFPLEAASNRHAHADSGNAALVQNSEVIRVKMATAEDRLATRREYFERLKLRYWNQPYAEAAAVEAIISRMLLDKKSFRPFGETVRDLEADIAAGRLERVKMPTLKYLLGKNWLEVHGEHPLWREVHGVAKAF
jgi:hypothetical protein